MESCSKPYGANSLNSPVLYTFRRCPYAIRARMALLYAQIELTKIEVDLKNKPMDMLQASPKGTVPVLVLDDGVVIDESLDIMLWALKQSDPDNWLCPEFTEQCVALIQDNDDSFKPILDQYKYPERSEKKDRTCYRNSAKIYLGNLETLLTENPYLLSDHLSLADVALMPFIRQFYMVDMDWFKQSEFQHLLNWLCSMINSNLFQAVMAK